jgi:hypothetical protein
MVAPNRTEFRTVDGTILRGDFYPAEQKGAPLVVMTQGVSHQPE